LAALAAALSTEALAADAVATPSEVAAQIVAYRPAAEDQGHFNKYFFFHKPGVSLEAASADLQECWGYASGLVLSPGLPSHVPPPGSAAPAITSRSITNPPGLYRPGGIKDFTAGATSAVVLALIGPAAVRAVGAANLRKCMGFKGYGRYGLSKSLWETLNPKDGPRAIALQAEVAAGPAPAQESLVP
jgi:hypothetical protein